VDVVQTAVLVSAGAGDLALEKALKTDGMLHKILTVDETEVETFTK
jgi:hypothetical protein